MNHTTGVCSLQFTPDESDFGEWICEFVIDEAHVQAELGSASILLLNNSPGTHTVIIKITITCLFIKFTSIVQKPCKDLCVYLQHC